MEKYRLISFEKYSVGYDYWKKLVQVCTTKPQLVKTKLSKH